MCILSTKRDGCLFPGGLKTDGNRQNRAKKPPSAPYVELPYIPSDCSDGKLIPANKNKGLALAWLLRPESYMSRVFVPILICLLWAGLVQWPRSGMAEDAMPPAGAGGTDPGAMSMPDGGSPPMGGDPSQMDPSSAPPDGGGAAPSSDGTNPSGYRSPPKQEPFDTSWVIQGLRPTPAYRPRNVSGIY